MSDLVPFTFDGAAVRVITDEAGEPWFVAADIARILGYRDAPNMVRRLDAEDRGTRSVSTPSGEQAMTVVSEPGLYSAVLGSQLDGAKRFKRWITTEVLPAIRKTGGYRVAPRPTGSELLALAIIEAQSMLTEKDERIAEQARQLETMAPAAEAWDNLASTHGDYSLRDAAQILDRDPDISTGQNRLSAYLREIGWVDRQGIPYQRHVDAGRLRSRIRYYDNPRTGERTLADPQVRLTAKGVEALRSIMTAAQRAETKP